MSISTSATLESSLLGKRKRAWEPAIQDARVTFGGEAANDSSRRDLLAIEVNGNHTLGGTAVSAPRPNSHPSVSPQHSSSSHSQYRRNDLTNPALQPLSSRIQAPPQPEVNGCDFAGIEMHAYQPRHTVRPSQNASLSFPTNSPGHNALASSPLEQQGGSDGDRDEADARSSIISRFTGSSHEGGARTGLSPNDISLPAAASFFRTYFTVIHPQYPFLDVGLCTDYYTAWKDLLFNGGSLTGWPAFVVNMIFAIGSLIESRSDVSPYPKYQDLKSMAQAEQSIMVDSTSTPLTRLQAMLLSAMFALHAENTWRIAYISGAILRFASLNRFHRLRPDPNSPSDLLAVRVWSCAYVLDRSVSSALGTPVSLPDMYISTPLFEATDEPERNLPWLSDCASKEHTPYPDLTTFAHVCKIRAIQSFFMHMVEKDQLEHAVPLELEMHMLKSLREWEDPQIIAKHSMSNSDGYQSATWLQHIGQLTRLSISFVNRSNMFTSTADTALQASCAACTSFRSLQRKKQIAQPWLVVLSQFRAAVTLWYIVWARAIHVPREASDAFRSSSAVLAIFADRWPKAEHYRDCFEFLAASIPRCQPLGHLCPETRSNLVPLVRKLEETGIHRTTSRMLWDMCNLVDESRQT